MFTSRTLVGRARTLGRCSIILKAASICTLVKVASTSRVTPHFRLLQITALSLEMLLVSNTPDTHLTQRQTHMGRGVAPPHDAFGSQPAGGTRKGTHVKNGQSPRQSNRCQLSHASWQSSISRDSVDDSDLDLNPPPNFLFHCLFLKLGIPEDVSGKELLRVVHVSPLRC